MRGLGYFSIAGLTLPRLALHFSCVKHSVNTGRAKRASRLHKCHHLQQENTLFCWQRALPSVPAQRPCTVYQRQLQLGSKVALSQPSSVSSQCFSLSGRQVPLGERRPLCRLWRAVKQALSRQPQTSHILLAQVRVQSLFLSTDSFQQIWFPS